jgi:hypothetical protein
VPFAKHKSRRSPLQRLSDQRRSLALAGLAAGAVFSAAVFRRKRSGEEIQLESSVQFEAPAAAVPPEPEAPIAPADSGPPPAVDVPAPASEPEFDDSPRPINAAPAVAAPSSSAAASRAEPATAPPPTLEPATGELSAEEASILAVLAQAGRVDDDRTATAVATSLERDTGDVTDVLRKLGAEGVVSGELYAATGDKIWVVTERGVRRLGAQS